QPDGSQRLDQEHSKAWRRDHRHRLSVRRRPEDRQAGARQIGRRQGNASVRQITTSAFTLDCSPEQWGLKPNRLGDCLRRSWWTTRNGRPKLRDTRVNDPSRLAIPTPCGRFALEMNTAEPSIDPVQPNVISFTFKNPPSEIGDLDIAESILGIAG